MMSAINSAMLKLPKRAESSVRSKLIETFVDIGPLYALLSNNDHQILYGRRGSGKTHVLGYLASKKENEGESVVVIDLRNVGSSSGIYADGTIPLAERATRLLVDVLYAIYSAVYDFFIEKPEELDLSKSALALDELASAITEVKVVGNVEATQGVNQSSKVENQKGFSGSFSKAPSLEFGCDSKDAESFEYSQLVKRTGKEQLYVNFGATTSAFRKIVNCLDGKGLWVLLDEWSSLPLELQPYLGDLLRRSLFPIQGVVIKIAAIEHRSDFMIWRNRGDYTGIEPGGDAAIDVNLDDFMVFDNDSERAQSFFKKLIFQHVNAIATENNFSEDIPSSPDELVRRSFTDKRSFEEFVRFCLKSRLSCIAQCRPASPWL